MKKMRYFFVLSGVSWDFRISMVRGRRNAAVERSVNVFEYAIKLDARRLLRRRCDFFLFLIIIFFQLFSWDFRISMLRGGLGEDVGFFCGFPAYRGWMTSLRLSCWFDERIFLSSWIGLGCLVEEVAVLKRIVLAFWGWRWVSLMGSDGDVLDIGSAFNMTSYFEFIAVGETCWNMVILSGRS